MLIEFLFNYVHSKLKSFLNIEFTKEMTGVRLGVLLSDDNVSSVFRQNNQIVIL